MSTHPSLLGMIAAQGVAGASTRCVDAGGGKSWQVLRDEIVEQRLTGLAVECAEAGVLVLSASQLDELLALHEQQLAIDLKLERLLRTCVGAFERHRIEYRVLKGPAVARLAYDRPELRSFADVDVLFSGSDYDRAVCLLRSELGLVRRFDEPREGFDRRFGKGVCLTSPDGLELDAHRTLAAGPYGAMVDVDALFVAEPASIRLGAATAVALPAEFAFVHACLHAVLGGGARRLVPLLDAAALGRLDLDVGRVEEFCARSRVSAVVGIALQRVHELLGVSARPELEEVFALKPPSSFDRWALSTYSDDGASYAAQAAATFWVLPSMRARFAYARALAWPDQTYLRARDRGHLRRLTQSVGLGLRWRPR
jgi:Uncharacterised nucleotidyltransferase